MRFMLQIDTDRSPEGPETWEKLIGVARREIDRLEDIVGLTGQNDVRPLRFGVQSDNGYYTIGLIKVTDK